MTEIRTRLKPDRRRRRRHAATRLPAVRASILAGPDVEVVNVSAQGLLVTSDVRLMPGAGICLNFWFAGQHHLLSGHIARVDTSIQSGRVKYHAGVALDREFPAFDLPSSDAPAGAGRTENPRGSEREGGSSGLCGPAVLHDALEERRAEQDQQRTTDMLKAALRSSEHARKTVEAQLAAERTAWSEERTRLEAAVADSAQREAELGDHLATLTQREEVLRQDQREWSAERDRTREQLAAVAARLEATDRRIAELAEREESLVRALEEERSMLAALLLEKEQLLSEVEASRAHGAAAAERGEQLQRECERLGVDSRMLAAQLEATEAWCADQQELIYQLRTDMVRSYRLLEEWQRSSGPRRASGVPAELSSAAADSHGPRPALPEATAMGRSEGPA